MTFNNWIKCHFDTHVRRDAIIGVYIWEMTEKDKIVGYQVLVDIGERMLVFIRTKTKDEAEQKRDGLLMELDQ